MKRTFIHLSRAWYGEANLKNRLDDIVDEVLLQITDEIDNCDIVISWHALSSAMPHPRIHAFDDAWRQLSKCTDLIEMLGDLHGKSCSPKQFCEHLKELGFEDVTPVEAD